MNAEHTFASVCEAPDPQTRLAELKACKLESLIKHLRWVDSPATGIPGLILGMAELEAAGRWMTERKDRAGAVGEGFL